MIDALEFAEWIDLQCFRTDKHEWKYKGDNYTRRHTTKEMYEIFAKIKEEEKDIVIIFPVTDEKEISYFCLYDGKDYVGSGMNSTNKEDCLNDGIDFYFGDSDSEVELNNITSMTIEEKESRLAGIGIVLEEHNEEM